MEYYIVPKSSFETDADNDEAAFEAFKQHIQTASIEDFKIYPHKSDASVS